jgi:hypothetical protein
MHPASVRQLRADPAAETSRHAYNAAFHDLGLTWFWDAETHERLQASADERERIRIYLETQQAHLLKAYDAEFLVNAIHTTKQRRLEALNP